VSRLTVARDDRLDLVSALFVEARFLAKANDFRNYAGDVGGRAQADMNNFAGELDAFAAHDEENAHWQHEIAERLEHAIASANQVREWHLKMAQRLRDWLAANGS